MGDRYWVMGRTLPKIQRLSPNTQNPSPSKFRMRPIAKRFFTARLTTTPCDRLLLGNFYKFWQHPRGLVGTVTKWLFFGLSTGAPGVTARLHFKNKGVIDWMRRGVVGH